MSVSATECEDGVHPSQEEEVHVDAFYHSYVQSKLHYMGQTLLKLDVVVISYPFDMSLTYFLAFISYCQILGYL